LEYSLICDYMMTNNSSTAIIHVIGQALVWCGTNG